MNKAPWVVIPTYNEVMNIDRMVRALFALGVPGLQVLVVDDNSPDGTAAATQRLQPSFNSLHVLVREKKSGLGRAYVHGFGYAMEHGAEAIVQMDADFSHDPADVPRLLAGLQGHDVVIGSRYSAGLSIINWPLRRLLLSVAGNTYARFITGMPVKDVTGGFRAWRAAVLQKINLQTVRGDGYGFQISTLYRAWRTRVRVVEVPITFTERREGQSKMTNAIIWEAFWLVWRLRFFG